MVKGIGYALEAMMASVVIFLFIFGTVEVTSPDQDWNDYQRELAAQDLTYSMKASGKLTSFLKRGETGSLQTAFAEISDRDMEASGAVSNLPISHADIGYFTVPDKRENQSITEVESGDRCHDDLNELERFANASDPIYRTEDSELADTHDVTLYFANTNPTGVEDAKASAGYDTLWVDNGTQECQFASEDGPFYLEQIFFWGDSNTSEPNDFYEFKGIDTDTSEEARFYQATQAHNISQTFNKEVNGIRTSTSTDMVDFEEIDGTDYSILIFPEDDSITEINSGTNEDILISHLVSDPVLFLANPDESEIDNGFFDRTGFDWIGTGYESAYGGGAVDADFSPRRSSLDMRTLYTGLNGDPSFQMFPPEKVVSNTSSRLEASRTLYSPSLSYDLSEWNRTVTGMSPGGPDPEGCGDSYTGTVNLVESPPMDIANIAVGRNSTDSCFNRALMLDLNNSGTIDSDIYVNGERIKVANREYAIDLVDCGTEGECAGFIALGQQNVELMPNTASFDGFNGDNLALLGYNDVYTQSQKKIIASSVYWLLRGQTRFEGRSEPDEISTVAIGGIDEQVYMPYEINLRWSE